jgi:hypothetical protein
VSNKKYLLATVMMRSPNFATVPAKNSIRIVNIELIDQADTFRIHLRHFDFLILPIFSSIRSRLDLQAEIFALGHQILVLKRSVNSPLRSFNPQ